ncbi:MAG: hypothetical protein SFW66_09600 [Gammaproteobacteria bacterium]|nr:hypothetical protein [Gammaproteobacteria bacterium]
MINPRCDNDQKHYIAGLLTQIENMTAREEKSNDDAHLIAFYNSIQSNHSILEGTLSQHCPLSTIKNN